MKKILLLVIISICGIISCDAPRLNPLDWQNPNNKLGQIDGYILSSSRNPLSGVKIIWKNQNIFTSTDAQGYFKIENIQMKNGMLIFEKEGLAKDSIYVEWNNQKVKHLQEIILSYIKGKFSGYVYTIPRVAVSGVRVLWKVQNLFTETNSEGYYEMENVSMNNGWIYFEKEGLSKDSFYVEWGNEEVKQIPDIILYPTIGTLDGYVYAVPHSALSNVKVLWKNQNILIETNSDGYYKFENISMKNGWLYFEKNGFAKDSIYITWNNQKVIRANEVILYPTIGTLDGFVYDISFRPIKDVKIYWKNQKLFEETNSSGYYKFENVSLKDGWLIFEKTGFKKDSVYVSWGSQNYVRVSDRILSYTTATIYGYVKTVALPRRTIPGVKVYWKNQSMITQTDASGFYQFENVIQNNGWLYFEKEGYSKDSVFVQFNNLPTKQIEDRFLNSNPKLSSLSIYTTVQNRYPDIQVQRLYINAEITDDEKDVDSVFVKNNSFNFYKRLVFNPETNKYENNFRTVDLKVNSLEDAIGTDFIIIAKEKSGKTFTIGSGGIKRLITKEIIIESPVNRAIVSSTPTFVWKKFTPGFNFKYTVQVYTDEVAPILVWEKKNISKDAVETTCDVALSPGDYYWVVICTDDFENSSISKPGTFTVK
ncbi:carboxypeptidase-like regulatory domain-containing protein [Rosettibacter firmus]|uniref:carboxypeptidase-like regulatory domain-containing protein n=1 Tax=Rosettibacter firmus TaxID=3111522 RepID=UPI00336C139B